MITVSQVFFWFSLFVIFWAMIGYPISLKIVNKIVRKRELKKDYENLPTVTVMIVAHNEERVIEKKLKNIIDNDYPKELISYLVASDNSNDKTNEIVEQFIKEHTDLKIQLYITKEHKGKTNAQNEAQKQVQSEILIMTDANSIFAKNSITELACCFIDNAVSYVCGKLLYVNSVSNDVAAMESSYWDGELIQREIESSISSITAGNGAIYACRNVEYYDFKPINCHDFSMPSYYVQQNKKALFNTSAVAYEKAGEVVEDEYKRKVRMNRTILTNLILGLKNLNFIKYGWYSYFYFGHRTCRYALWLAHFFVFIGSILLIKESWIYILALGGQVLFYLLACIRLICKIDIPILNMMYYYSMTIIAQWIAVIRQVTGKAKPIWEKAESTR